MSIRFTFHGYLPLGRYSENMQVLGQQTADAIEVAAGAASPPFAAEGLVRVVAIADCKVRFADASAAEGERWYAGDKEVRWVEAGDVISVAAP